MAMAACVLLVSGYIGSFGGMCWLWGRGVLDEAQVYALQETVFIPMQFAGDTVSGFGEWCFIKGMGLDVDDFRLELQAPESQQ